MKGNILMTAWAVTTASGEICRTSESQLCVYDSHWEAQFKRLKFLVSQRCLEGYYVK